MTFKEWDAVIMIASGVVVSAWVLVQAMTEPAPDLATVAMRLVSAIGATIVVNIVAVIVTTILVSIARREEFKDEKADERDRAIVAKSMRNAYFVASITGLVCLLMLAFGVEPALAIYALFGGLMLAGVLDAGSRLVYYRIG